MTTLYCGMTGSNGPIMFKCMDEALNNGAEGIAIFTVKVCAHLKYVQNLKLMPTVQGHRELLPE